jgi:hypothetical protein
MYITGSGGKRSRLLRQSTDDNSVLTENTNSQQSEDTAITDRPLDASDAYDTSMDADDSDMTACDSSSPYIGSRNSASTLLISNIIYKVFIVLLYLRLQIIFFNSDLVYYMKNFKF